MADSLSPGRAEASRRKVTNLPLARTVVASLNMPRVRLLPVAVLCAALWSCAQRTQPTTQPLPDAAAAMSEESWVMTTLAALSLEERVGQMLFVPLAGTFENVRAATRRESERYIDDARVGGFIVGSGSPAEIALKVNQLQQRSRLPLLFAAELEWGARARLGTGTHDGATAFPYNMGMAATGEPALAELAGRITAAEARAVGIHWLLAPVLDINTNAANPLINIRSYGSNPATAALFGAAFIRGANDGGVLTTAKHFPGHGATDVDSNLEMPIIDADLRTLDERELLPFRSAIAAGVSSVMLAHVAMPKLTNGIAVPSSLAPELGTTLLRERLQFGGLVVTDAMTMGALREMIGYSPGEVAVRAVQAGADIVIAPPDPLLAHNALVSAVRSGRINYARVDSSVVRILRAKARVGLHRNRTVSLDSAARVVAAPEHESVAADIAARSLVLARDSTRLLPLDPRRIRNVALIAFGSAGDASMGVALADELTRIYGRGVTFTRVDEFAGAGVHDTATVRAARADATVLATFMLPVAGQGHIRVPDAARTLAARLQQKSQRMVVVSFGEPYGPASLPGASTYLLAWQPHEEHAQRAAARALAGRISIPGKLPIDLPRAPIGGILRAQASYGLEFARAQDVGMDSVQLARVDSIVREAIADGAAPGASLAVGRHGKLVRLRGYGLLDRRRGFGTVTDSTLYDLASLTKVVATTSALMMLIDQGKLSIDDPVKKHIPEWRGSPEKERVTIRNLLLHNSGLAAYAPLWRDLRGRDQYRRRIAAMSLEYAPGTRTLYSDFGIVLLGLIVEQVSGQPLDVLVRDRLFAPLGMRDTGFNPRQWPYGTMSYDSDGDAGRAAPDPIITRIAPTEIDTAFAGARVGREERTQHVHGQVHDENAFAMGGVAGHAGLFSSARDMAIFAQLMLNRGFYGGERFIDPETVNLFTRRQQAGSSRALGWDTPEGSSSAGNYFTASSFGHTGFTGTSIWVDPERDVFVVLLTNRVNPTRDNQRHVALRRAVADAVQLAITDMPVTRRE
jgi:beta-N-acetylhexosaminidase